MIVRVMVSEAGARFVSSSTKLAVERLLDRIVRRRVLHTSTTLGGRRGSVGRLREVRKEGEEVRKVGK